MCIENPVVTAKKLRKDSPQSYTSFWSNFPNIPTTEYPQQNKPLIATESSLTKDFTRNCF